MVSSARRTHQGLSEVTAVQEPAIDHWSVPDDCRDFALRAACGAVPGA